MDVFDEYSQRQVEYDAYKTKKKNPITPKVIKVLNYVSVMNGVAVNCLLCF